MDTDPSCKWDHCYTIDGALLLLKSDRPDAIFHDRPSNIDGGIVWSV